MGEGQCGGGADGGVHGHPKQGAFCLVFDKSFENFRKLLGTPNKVAAEPVCKTAEDLLPLLTAVGDDPEEDTDDDDEEDEDKLENSIGAEEEDDSFTPLELCANVSSERLDELHNKSH